MACNNVVCVQAGNAIANSIYREDDKPLYHRGNSYLIMINLLSIVLFILTKVYYIWRNKHREKVWKGMSEDVSIIRATVESEGRNR